METKVHVAVEPLPASEPLAVPPEIGAWAAANRGRVKAGGRHYNLAELKLLVAQRETWGEYWDMPEHLAACPVCLALFEGLLSGVPQADPEALARMSQLDASGIRRWFRLVPALPKLARLAAVFAVLVSGAWYLVTALTPPAVSMVAGSVQLENGQEIAGGGTLPGGGATLQVTQSVTARFADGSEVVLERDSRFALETSRYHGQKVQLAEGKLFCQVAKQKEGRSFQVLTPVGEVTVVGTQFVVASHKAPDVAPVATPAGKGTGKTEKPGLRFLHPLLVGVHDDALLKSAERPSVVTVEVKEGVVLVRNRYGYQTRLSAGQTAVLRDNLRVIDVYSAPL